MLLNCLSAVTVEYAQADSRLATGERVFCLKSRRRRQQIVRPLVNEYRVRNRPVEL